MRVKDAVGRYGEQIAARFLQQCGMRLLERNWRCSEGEIDLLAIDGDELVVVEVKTRSSDAFGSPAEAVTRAKAGRLRRLAARWLEAHPDRPAVDGVRFDVVAVVRSAQGPPTVDHFRGAF